jgi:alpha-1,4-glucan:alpha-1,4-glucan 6-glycosyltransferase
MNTTEQVAHPALSTDLELTESRAANCAPDCPISIYEVHLGSWKRVPEEKNRPLTCSELAPKLADYVQHMNFTHVQLHSAAGIDPQELQFLINYLHQRDVGVILEMSGPAQTMAAAEAGGFPADGGFTDGETILGSYRYKWDLAWAEEMAAYFSTDPLYRKFRHAQFTQRDVYAFDGNYILPLSDKLVARPRSSLFTIMPGDAWQKFANLRLLLACTYLFPGKKLVFMGNEFGQQNPWTSESSLDWHLVNEANFHGQLMNWVARLNWFYRAERALHQTDSSASGFQWVDTSDASRSVISFLRTTSDAREILLVMLNFTPVPRYNYRVGVPRGGFWTETLNSDAPEFGGSGQGNLGGMEAAPFGWNFQSHSLMLTLPPLAGIVLKASA